MQIKPRTRLTVNDFPLVESPYLATRLVKKALLGRGEIPLRFDPYDIPGFSAGARPEFIHARLLSSLESGDLVLVFNPLTSGKPLDPPVVWRPDLLSSATSGKWVASPSNFFVSMASEINALNRDGVTPGDLGLATAVGSTGHQSVMGEERRDSSKDSGIRDHRLTLPLGAAAGIAPLIGASERTMEPTDSAGMPLHVTVGVFTDGTLNNAGNIELFQQRVERECLAPFRKNPDQLETCQERLRLMMGESYANARTNIAKLWRLYRSETGFDGHRRKVGLSIYQPGVGTATGEPDSLLSMATGIGETGIVAQMERVYEDMVASLVDLYAPDGVKELTLDLFGFSRGAATARHIANDVLNGIHSRLARVLLMRGLEWPSKVNIRFIGLFDTVPGVVNPKRLDFAAGDEEYEPVQLFLDSSKLNKVVHLTAKDERRRNFSLSSVLSPDGTSPANFREVSLPGAHSDIGGGYQDSQEENLLLHPTLTITGSESSWPRQTLEWDSLTDLHDEISSEGWIGGRSLAMPDGSSPGMWIDEIKSEHPLPNGRVELSLRMRRHMRGEYSRVSLRLMHVLARKEGVPFDGIDEADSEFSLPDELSGVCEEVLKQVEGGYNSVELRAQQSELLKQQYIHYSDHYNLLEFLLADKMARLEIPFQTFQPSRPTVSRERDTHPNRK